MRALRNAKLALKFVLELCAFAAFAGIAFAFAAAVDAALLVAFDQLEA